MPVVTPPWRSIIFVAGAVVRQPRRPARHRRRRLPRAVPQSRPRISLHGRRGDQPHHRDRHVELGVGRPRRPAADQHEARACCSRWRRPPAACLAASPRSCSRSRSLQKLFGFVAGGRRGHHADAPAAPQRDPRSDRRPRRPRRALLRRRERRRRDLPGQAAAARARRVVPRRQRVVAARHRRRHHQGADAERLVRRPAARGGGDERVHDWRHGDRRRDHLLRPRPARAGAGGGGGARRAARLVGRDALRRRGVGEVAEAADGGRAVHRRRR